MRCIWLILGRLLGLGVKAMVVAAVDEEALLRTRNLKVLAFDRPDAQVDEMTFHTILRGRRIPD